MPCLLYALLTAPVEQSAHVPGFIKWLASLSGWEAFALQFGAAVAVCWGFVKAATRGFFKKRKEDMAAADKPVAPKLVPESLPLPAPQAVPPSHAAELQSLRNEKVLIETELLSVQEHARKLRKAHDELLFENAGQSRALYAERAANDELRQKSAALLAEMARLRAEGPAQVPPLPRRPARER